MMTHVTPQQALDSLRKLIADLWILYEHRQMERAYYLSFGGED